MRSVEHQYAATAFKYISELGRAERSAEANGPSPEEYGRLCQAFGSLVMLNGLRLTIAFFLAKSKRDEAAHKQYLRHLSEAVGNIDLTDIGSLPADSAGYRALTRKVLKASTWFERYAVAILKVDKPRE